MNVALKIKMADLFFFLFVCFLMCDSYCEWSDPCLSMALDRFSACI